MREWGIERQPKIENTMNTSQKRTRAERKAARNAKFAAQQQIQAAVQAANDAAQADQDEHRRRFAAQHPIRAGLVPLVDYVPPRGTYRYA